MNKYGKFAQQAWQTLSPDRYAQLEDPNQFFSTLGEEAQNQMVLRWEQLQGPDVAGESTFQKIGRINAAKLQAEEIIRAEMLTPTPEDGFDEEEGFDDESLKNFAVMEELEKARALSLSQMLD